MTTLAKAKAEYRTAVKQRLLRKRAAVVDLLKKFSTPESGAVDFLVEADCLVVSHGFAHVNDLPRARACSSKQAAKELRELRDYAAALRRHIKTMHRTSLAAVEQQGNCRRPLVVEDDMQLIERAAKAAAGFIEAQPA